MNVAADSIFGLGLCAGTLGLELALEIAIPGYRTACVVEREIASAGRVAARVSEGSLPEFAQWDDVATFDGRPWRGVIHLIAAGFPCQPWSVAGKRQGTSDERWIWPDIARIIEEIKPDAVFLENVPGLLLDPDSGVDRWDMEEQPDDALGGMGTVLRDLARLGFDAEWLSLRASDVGASHGRKRVFILGVANTGCAWIGRAAQPPSVDRAGPPDDRRRTSGALGDTECSRPDGSARRGRWRVYEAGEQLGQPQIFAPGPNDLRWADVLVQFPWLRPSLSQAEAESYLRDVADGLAALVVGERTGALRTLGNGVVPLQAALAFTILARRLSCDTLRIK